MKIKYGISCIYEIRNIINNNVYIGRTCCFHRRQLEHLSLLISNSHYNKYLQNSFNKHGIKNFKFEIISTCPEEYLIKLEQWFINNLNPNYNSKLEAGTNIWFNRKSLDIDLEKEIINLYKLGFTIKKITNKFNITGRVISKLLRDNNIKLKSGGESRKLKQVYVYDINGDLLFIDRCVRDVAIKLKIKEYIISSYLNSNRKNYGNYYFSYTNMNKQDILKLLKTNRRDKKWKM